jgi:hypothetical protein
VPGQDDNPLLFLRGPFPAPGQAAVWTAACVYHPANEEAIAPVLTPPGSCPPKAQPLIR